MKKLLTTLMSISLVSTIVTSSVVACKKNKDPEKTIVTTFKANPQKWLTSKSFSAEDINVLANTNANPLATDEYGRIYGDLFSFTNNNYSANAPYVGESSNKNKTWTYTLRNEASWSNYKGKFIRAITTEDFINTAKFVLNPENASELINIWKEFIVGANELYNEAKTNNSESFDVIFEKYSKNDRLGIKVGEGNKIIFNLTKSSPYFESLLTYSCFSPIPEEALQDSRLITDFRKGFYSGQFVPTDYKQDIYVVLDKNSNYHFKNKTDVDRVRMVFSQGSSSRERELYEAGTLDTFNLNSNDELGWKKYVGDPNETLKKDGVVKYTTSPDDAASWLMFYNYLDSDYTKGTNKNRGLRASRALQYKEVRKLIEAGLNRTDWATYYSKVYDGKNTNISSQLRNTFVPSDFVNFKGKNFLQYEVDALNDLKITMNDNKEVNETDLQDGGDFVRKLLTNSDDKNSDTYKNSFTKLLNTVKEIKSKDEALKDGEIVLISAKDPTSASSVGVYKSEMIAQFNELAKGVIKIEEKQAVDWNGYSDMLKNGDSDINFSSWSPDYQDPMTYLSTLKIDGDFDLYMRQQQLFKFEDFNSINTSETITANDAYKNLKQKNEEWFKEVVVEQNNKSELFESRFNYTKEVLNIDKNLDGEERIKSFAKLEAQSLYQDFVVMAFMRRSPKMTFTISKGEPFRLSRSAAGSSSFKFFNSVYKSNLLTYDEIEELRKIYENKKNEVLINPSTNRDSDIWS
ncbi:oligopeptide transport system substrate-binding protein [Spiroplasma gladiatoris]|uniref:Oligopeptide transport system substrate-binding protein n=1 Tax=Spiroplasma gladiatoris TaxID=2143 RepID=A0A4P7AK57_9MOLU|nr:ABC transporter substrate-binding protein [Spiroplasma gladiatoris]QBQ07940.1 oligopeptide transport system substrate-binding protein [Spiroplasma gladiatoris]